VSAFRILEAAGVHPETDIQKQALGAAQSADALRDGKIDAFFWSGGIPTGALLDLASRRGRTMKLVPNGELLPALQHRYGSSVYHASMIPKETYPGTGADVTVISVSNVLAAHEALSEELAYRITKALFDHHAELAAIHPEAAKLALETAVQGSPIPFHPGAVRFYKERGVWREEQ
jgi:TRAP transporter TAXI family solute receptor